MKPPSTWKPKLFRVKTNYECPAAYTTNLVIKVYFNVCDDLHSLFIENSKQTRKNLGIKSKYESPNNYSRI